ncbi:uncharacterized protein P174DRAFT_427691 [Aspergillus novofumigatus IBT 16806]|uniref:Uncharacterized protein n=1 Tax=Aspergillus novofumigatus (strain IBT 16806) TaxID=1392255 RepID=A0A2I1CPH7_ASPN1|nr:uncharacterized protein P174DRAFT_427691 [Aspergillus novofumigatus IBT 16806]PKX99513.1 hypothetical protein P174DRAFT_427691 [Aspergillus novofumigatus IBT 16806]
MSKGKANPRRKPGERPTIINMPPDPDAPIQAIELSSGSPSATQSQYPESPSQAFPNSIIVNGAYCLVTGIKAQLGTAADILFMHVLGKGSLLSSNMEGLNRSARRF